MSNTEALRQALHEISLCAQNSASSKEECGRIARAALAQPAASGEPVAQKGDGQHYAAASGRASRDWHSGFHAGLTAGMASAQAADLASCGALIAKIDGLDAQPAPAPAASGEPVDLIALIDAYGAAAADAGATGHQSAKAYAALARSNLMDAISAPQPAPARVPPDPFLFVAMDDDKRAHLTWCADESEVHAAVAVAMFWLADGEELDAEHAEHLAANVAELLDSGALTFEGDPPLYLYRVAGVAPVAQPAPARVPLTNGDLLALWGSRSDGPDSREIVSYARAVLAAAPGAPYAQPKVAA